MATLTVNTYSAASGGYRGANNADWTTTRNSTTGTGDQNHQIISVAGYFLRRSFFVFDTSSLPNNAIVSGWRLKLYRDDTVISFGNAASASIHVVPSTQSDPTSLADADFDNISYSSKGSIALASTSNNAYFTITGSDVSQISLTSYTKLAMITSLDLNNTTPTGTAAQIGVQNYAAANKPILEVDYTVPGGMWLMF